MHILAILKYYYPKLGGGELVLYELFNKLSFRGHKIYIITSHIDGTDEYEEQGNVYVYRIKTNKNFILSDILFLIKSRFMINKLSLEKGIDIILSGAYLGTIIIGSIKQKNSIPSVTYVTYFFEKTWSNPSDAISSTMYYYLMRIAMWFGKYDEICCPSNIIKNKLNKFARSEITVVPSPIDLDEIEYILKHCNTANIRALLRIKNNKFLLFVGRLSPEKNVNELIETLSRVIFGFKLVLVGEGGERGKIEDTINKYKLNNKVVLLGRKSHKETLAIINACDILILPSKSEVFPTVILEALALNKPVIALNVGGISEMKSPNLYLITKLNQIEDLIISGMKAKIDASILNEYNLDKVASNFEDMLLNVIKKRKEEVS
jgi:glycosyltransferase involved in cell wall biosynthesis